MCESFSGSTFIALLSLGIDAVSVEMRRCITDLGNVRHNFSGPAWDTRIVEVFAFADQLAKAYGVPGEKAYPILNELDSQVGDFCFTIRCVLMINVILFFPFLMRLDPRISEIHKCND